MGRRPAIAASKTLMIPRSLGDFHFEDEVWPLANDNPATNDRCLVINWRMPVGEGRLLTDPEFAGLLFELKVFLLTRLIDARETSDAAASTAAKYAFCLKPFVMWIVEEELGSVGQIDEECTWRYLDYLADHLEATERLTWGNAYDHVRTVVSMYQQRGAMRDAGCVSLPEPPFAGRSANEVVRRDLGLTRTGRLLPIPDEVALPVLTAAIRLIGGPADDVINLQKLHDKYCTPEALERDRTKAYSRYNEAIFAYQFKVLSGDVTPWHDPIRASRSRVVGDRSFMIKPSQQVRRLVIAVATACLIVLQGLTGMRASELLGLVVNGKCKDGLPSCVKKLPSEDHVLELWYVSGRVIKGGQRDVKWLIGSRTAGSSYEPPTVRALRVLARLMEPWRLLSGRRNLVLTFSQGQGLPNDASSVGRMTAGTMSVLMKEFVAEWCDLSGAVSDSEDVSAISRSIRGHRWRSTFALFMFRVDHRLLPAIGDHFKHMSAAAVEDGYIGTDPALIESLESGRVQHAAEFLLRITSPHAKLAGGGALLVGKYREELTRKLDQFPGDTRLDRAMAFVDFYELPIYRGAGGACLISFAPSHSTCHRRAGHLVGIPVPNYATRSVETCLGCRLHAVLAEDRPFWLERLRTNQGVAAAARAEGALGPALLAERRARQSKAILSALSAKTSEREG